MKVSKLKTKLKIMAHISITEPDSEEKFNKMTAIFRKYYSAIMDNQDATRCWIPPDEDNHLGTAEVRLYEYQINGRIDLDADGELDWQNMTIVDCFNTFEI